MHRAVANSNEHCRDKKKLPEQQPYDMPMYKKEMSIKFKIDKPKLLKIKINQENY